MKVENVLVRVSLDFLAFRDAPADEGRKRRPSYPPKRKVDGEEKGGGLKHGTLSSHDNFRDEVSSANTPAPAPICKGKRSWQRKL
jgi:hypothetical protein